MNIKYKQYWDEVSDLSINIVDEAIDQNAGVFERDEVEELINDRILHETIDGHEWVIYYANNLDVLKHTNNEDYAEDNFGGEGLVKALKEGGVTKLHTSIVFWALYADVQENINEVLEEKESE